METSNITYRKLLRYFSSLSSKTLYPSHSPLTSPNHSHTLHTLAPSLQFSQSVYLSNRNFDSQKPHYKFSLPISSSGSPTNSCKRLSLHNFSRGLPSKSSRDSYEFSKKQSLCKSSKGSSLNCNLKHPTLLSAGLLNIIRSSWSNGCLVYRNIGVDKPINRNCYRCFSASSDDGSVIFDEEVEVDSFDIDAFLGEVKENDVHTVNVPPISSVKPLSSQLSAFKTPSTSSNTRKGKVYPPKRISEIIDLIKRDEGDLESRLCSIASNIEIRSTILVFEALNWHKVSGMRFFRWVQSRNHKLRRNADFCSLVINNCGWLNDFENMTSLLQEFRLDKICLSELAFGFLPLFVSSKSSAEESIKAMVGLLNEVGGSCRSSGIHSLIQMLCTLDLFDMAKFVMEISERNASRINILIREKCKRGRIAEAHDFIKEMRDLGCHADTRTYNLILSSLCKIDKADEAFSVLEEMKEQGVNPDALSFEIFIHFLCRLGKFNRAYEVLDQMASEGLQPRLTIHTTIIKALVNAEQYEEAYRYVTDSSIKDRRSGPLIYTLLANLHCGKGDLLSAQNIILEMMDKGLRPNFNVFMNVVRRLQDSGKGSVAEDLKNRYSSFKLDSGSRSGE